MGLRSLTANLFGIAAGETGEFSTHDQTMRRPGGLQ